jgi:hypothetical protein
MVRRAEALFLVAFIGPAEAVPSLQSFLRCKALSVTKLFLLQSVRCFLGCELFVLPSMTKAARIRRPLFIENQGSS